MRFEINILGSGSALPLVNRNSPSQYIIVQERHLLFDCGEGTQLQLRKAKFKFQKIDHIFISHLHGDHFLGLVGLLSTFNLLGRKKSIFIYGPEELHHLLNLTFKSSQSKLRFQMHFYATNAEKNEPTPSYRRRRYSQNQLGGQFPRYRASIVYHHST